MTTGETMAWVERRPFVPFYMVLTNGRELQISHPENATMGRYGHVVVFFHPSQQVETVDVTHIVSMRTLYPSTDFQSWAE
jgi:hypothetical protein